MKTIKTSLLVLMSIAVTAAPLNAQSPAESKPDPKAAAAVSASATPAGASPQPGDPFVKKQAAGNPGKNAAAQKSGPVFNIYFTVEIYALAQTDAAELIAEDGGGKARHERILELARQGKARFEALMSSVTRDGQRAVVEPLDEVRYPAVFSESSNAGEPAIPTDYETRNVGNILEYEPALSADHERCDVNMVLSSVRWQGFRDYTVSKGEAVAQPLFRTRKITASMALPVGGMGFLGTLSDQPRFGPDKDEVRLVFGRVDLVEAAPAAPARQMGEDVTLEHQLSFYSLPREAGREMLATMKKSGDCYAAVQALAGRKEAQLERITILNTKPGQRAVVEEIEEVRYASEYKVINKETNTTQPGRSISVGVATGFETRSTGLTLEIEPDPGQNSTMDINIAPKLVRLAGDLETTGVSAQYPSQPVFEDRMVTTSFSATLGEQMLIGTFNPPGDTGVNGRKDTGRIWLGFLRTAVVKP